MAFKKIKDYLKNKYEEHYKPLLLVSFGLLLICFIIIGVHYFQTGSFVDRDVTLKGGYEITLTLPVSSGITQADIKDSLSSLKGKDISIVSVKSSDYLSYLISTSDATSDEILNAIEAKTGKLTKDEYSVTQIGSSLGSSFFKDAMIAVILAFLAMSIVVFITFRTPIPSLAVILCGFSNIIFALAMVNLFGIKLSTAGFAAFLMLIGYSIDTDILLSTRVLKRKEGTVTERTLDSMKTGLTMTGTAIAAITVAYFVTNSDVVKQIMLILIFGLIADIPFTWIQNAGILRWYVEEKNKHVKA